MNTCQCPTSQTTSEAELPVHRPRYQTHQDENGVSVQIALPGVRKEDLKLTLHEANLVVEADRGDGIPDSWKLHRGDDRPQRYRLDVRLTQKLDGSQAHAAFDSGVLTLQVPFREEAKPRQIQVN